MELNGFTPTQKKLLALLDIAPQSKKMIKEALGDELMANNAIEFHISTLRKKMAIYGLDIVARQGIYYKVRYVRCASKE